VVAALLGCGARTSLDAVTLTTSDGGTVTDASVPSVESGVAASDPCPSAVAGPKPMAGNCSTRDGRSRVAAPTAPHVTWTTKLPTDSTGQVGPSYVASDALGDVYVVTTGEEDESVAALVHVRGTDGSILWTEPISPDQETSTPIVLSHGGVDLVAYNPSDIDSVFTFDATSGASTSTAFAFGLYYAPQDIAVGSDGSLYVTHEDGVGTVLQTTYVSRVAADGAVLWTSVDLGTLGPPLLYDDGEAFPSAVALGKDDLVVIVIDKLTGSPSDAQVFVALEPGTGEKRWITVLDGDLLSGPVVRSDGTIVGLLDDNETFSVVILDPMTGAPTSLIVHDPDDETHQSPTPAGIDAVTRSGVMIMSTGAAEGPGLFAFGGHGELWGSPGSGADGATIASNGIVVAFGPTLRGLDVATGATLWDLAPPSPSCIVDGALTSSGELVVLQCDGTLFGASD
jgi:hypothetical protein